MDRGMRKVQRCSFSFIVYKTIESVLITLAENLLFTISRSVAKT